MSLTEPIALPGSVAIMAATRRMLRPLVRLLIQRGITFPVVADLLRGLYVDVASSDLLTDPKAPTDSRISLMTGVHRKEIRRLRSMDQSADAEPEIVTVATQVIARWLALREAGSGAAAAAPPVLPRAAQAPAASFEGLVAAVTTDIRPRAALEEWIGLGLVGLDAEDRVHLNVDAFLPRPGGEEQVFFLGRNLHDHLAAGAANVLAEQQAPFLDRSAHYDQVSPETARRIEDVSRVVATRALAEINRLALEMIAAEEASPPQSVPPTARVNVGVFIYRDDAPPRA
jgi:hypothetical protein